ncbi:MAG: tetratricopeptide repeat protein [Chloroflexia bacterium]
MAMVSLQSCYDRARNAMAQGDYEKAEAICRHILQYYPQDLGTHQLLGQIYLERKQPRQAQDYFRRVLEMDPENVSAHWGMGIAYQDEGKLEAAVGELEQALEIKPDLSDLRGQLLRLYTELYGASRAQLRLSRAGLGRLYVKGEMLDRAIEEFREVLKADPSRLDVQMSLLEALWQSGQMEEAARIAEAVLERSPQALKANLILGYLRLQAGRREEGEALLRQAVAGDPNNTMARALFELAPVRVPPDLLTYDAATLPDFSEAEWEARRAAAERPAEVAMEAAVEEMALPVEEKPAVAEPLGVSWLDRLATGEGVVAEEAGEEIPGLAPFSLEGLEAELGEEEVFLPEEVPPMAAVGAERPAPPTEAPEEEAMRPFTLEELGLTPEEIAALHEAVAESQAGQAREEEAVPSGVAPFTPEEGEAAVTPPEEEFPGLAPFAPEEVALAEEELPVGVRPFSLEDLGLEEPAGEVELPLPEAEEIEGEELEAALPAFSWQEPGMPKAPAFREELVPEEEVPAGPTLFEKMLARRREVLGEEAPAEEVTFPAVQPSVPEEAEEVGPAVAAPVAEGWPPEEAPAEAAVEPFSLEALGLEEAPAEAAVEPFSLEGLEEAGEVEGVRPFSLEELGLEAPERMVPVAEEAPAAPAEEEVLRPFTLEELGLTPEEIAGLGLSPEELAGLGLPAEVPPAEAAAPPVEEALPAAVPVEAQVAPAVAPPSLEELRRQVAEHPQDERLRLTLAGACVEQGQVEEAVNLYKELIKTGRAGLEDEIIAGLQAWIEREQDRRLLHRLHRLLGDTYMKKGWYQQAINEYAWVLSK